MKNPSNTGMPKGKLKTRQKLIAAQKGDLKQKLQHPTHENAPRNRNSGLRGMRR
jgi:hypothetical protein